jgi:hypothetical protein
MILGILLVSLTDVYFFSIALPVVPLAGTTLIVATIVLDPALRQGLRNWSLASTVIKTALLVSACIFGNILISTVVFDDNLFVKSGVGIATGLLLACALRLASEHHQFLFHVTTFVGYIHIAIWLLQYVYYKLTGIVIDFSGALGENASRWNQSGIYVRLTGLFAEPATYSQFAVAMLTMRGVASRFRLTVMDGVLLCSMFASYSLTGVSLAVSYLVALVLSRLHFERILYIIPIAIAGMAILITWQSVTQSSGLDDRSTPYKERIENIETDQSAKTRFKTTTDFFDSEPEALLVGYGLGSERVAPYHNGYSCLLASTGLIGVGLITMAFILWVRAFALPLPFLIPFAVYLGSAPTFTIMFFWFWLGMMSILSLGARATSLFSDTRQDRTQVPIAVTRSH